MKSKYRKDETYVQLGSNNEKVKPEYRYNVELRVTDTAGNQVAYIKNGSLQVRDPRLSWDNEKKEYVPNNRTIHENVLFELEVLSSLE